ncbi:MAG: hypothetical protein LC777_11005 [Actinobacteria bacterium]|nr:hypothetical protein [Actinomycetota bacterium]
MSTTATAPSPATTAQPAKAASPAWTLSRVEGQRLLAHPLFVFGLATSLAAIMLADSDVIERSAMLSGDCFVMLGGALWTFLAAFLATSREGRDAPPGAAAATAQPCA